MNESNIKLVQRWVEEVWNANDLDALHQFHPPTFQNEGRSTSIGEVRKWHERMRTVYPDLQYTIEDIFALEEQVALRWMATGTHRASLWGIVPATGKEITWKGIHLLRIESGKIVRIWAVADTMAQLQQMGVQLRPKVDQ